MASALCMSEWGVFGSGIEPIMVVDFTDDERDIGWFRLTCVLGLHPRTKADGEDRAQFPVIIAKCMSYLQVLCGFPDPADTYLRVLCALERKREV